MKLAIITGLSMWLSLPLLASADAVFVPPQPPEEAAALGAVYRTIVGREAQVTFTSDAPLEDIVGKSNEVAGYAIVGPGEGPPSIVKAEWALPVGSLATGIPLRDEHMLSKEWLDAESFADIRFVLSALEDVSAIKQAEGFSTWSATLVGEMTLHGVTRTMRVPDARLSFLKESERTRSIAPGDLMLLKCDYEVRLSDYGVQHKDVPDKVSDSIKLSQLIRLTTAPVSSSRPSEANR